MSSVFCSSWQTGAQVFPFEKSFDGTKSECNGPADCVNPKQDELGEFMLILKDLAFDSLVSLWIWLLNTVNQGRLQSTV